jgi:predicted transposase/invertase (TIGR01784 family)
MYDSSLKSRWDYENSIAFAEEKAEERGLEKGRHEEALDIAREMKKDDAPAAQIAKFTKLSVEEIEKL